MRLEKAKPEEVLGIAKTYFYGGFAFLPWLWLVNFFYLYPVVKKRADLDKRVGQ
ncbi:hypothetical protein HK102_004053, partial [Quaeritorhiza haematococci]